MRTPSSPDHIRRICDRLKKAGKTIAFVPTMGALHAGHLSLIRRARKRGDILVVSIFVNPAQFGPKEDLSRYPRPLKKDLSLCRREGVDYVFCPAAKDLYPAGYETYVDLRQVTRGLCGKSRPGHFRGVATVVLKLFNLILPDYAFFGLKDYQQLVVIKRMAADLHLPVKIVGCPTVREGDGLALSSRNRYLSAVERKKAGALFAGLSLVKRSVSEGETRIAGLKRKLVRHLAAVPGVKIDYVSCVDADTLKPLKKYRRGHTLFVLAVWIGKTRLIDNMIL